MEHLCTTCAQAVENLLTKKNFAHNSVNLCAIRHVRLHLRTILRLIRDRECVQSTLFLGSSACEHPSRSLQINMGSVRTSMNTVRARPSAARARHDRLTRVPEHSDTPMEGGVIIATVSAPAPPCPACGGLNSTLLPIASRRKPFAYYLCRWCNHTWMTPKRAPEFVSDSSAAGVNRFRDG